MAVGLHIKDALNDLTAHVDGNHALRVSTSKPDVDPIGTPNRYRYLHGKLGTSGMDSGTLSQNINGSSTPQEFYIASDTAFDIYIMVINIVIADGNIAHNMFGGINPSNLVNGWDLYVKELGIITYLVENAFSSGEVVTQAGFFNPYGNAGTSWELTSYTGVSDAHTISIPMFQYVPGGLRLGRGTTDRLVSVIADDFTGLTDFFVAVHGYKHYPIDAHQHDENISHGG